MTITQLNQSSQDIVFLEGNANYTNIHYNTGEKTLSSYTLLRHQENLKDFIRINRKYLVNPKFIRAFKRDDSVPRVVLKNGLEFKIPRRRIKDFFEIADLQED